MQVSLVTGTRSPKTVQERVAASTDDLSRTPPETASQRTSTPPKFSPTEGPVAVMDSSSDPSGHGVVEERAICGVASTSKLQSHSPDVIIVSDPDCPSPSTTVSTGLCAMPPCACMYD